MKKYLLMTIMLALCTAAFAQDLGVYESAHETKNPLEVLYNKITRYIASQQKVPWAKSINRQHRAAFPHRSVGLKFDYILPRKDTPVPARLAATVNPRVALWQRALQSNPVLNRYVIKLSDAQYVADMPVKQVNLLARFLRNPVTVAAADPRYFPQQIQELSHYLVLLTFETGPQDAPLHLVFNCYTQEMFVTPGRTDVLGLPLTPKQVIEFHSFHKHTVPGK